MFRNKILALAARIKTVGFLDDLLRYNPVARYFVRAAMRERGVDGLLNRALCRAKRTEYGASFPVQLSRWPVLDKDTVRSRPQAFLAGCSFLRLPTSTGGTTGAALRLWRSLENIAAEQMFIDSLIEPFGYCFAKAKLAVLRADAFEDKTAPYPHARLTHGGKRLTLSSAHLNSATIDDFFAQLIAFSPEVLWIYPSAGLNLLRLCQARGLTLPVPVILSSSELLPASLHGQLASYFQAKVVNYYGQAERVCMAWAQEAGAFYFLPTYGHVELLSVEGEGGDTEAFFEIVATAYWNAAMPLVRYRTGDLVSVPASYGPEEIADVCCGLRPFTGLVGRQGEYIVGPDGSRIVGLNHIPKELTNVVQIQLVQTSPANVVVNVVPDVGFTQTDEARVMASARAKIPPFINIEVCCCNNLVTNKRGKAPFVVRLFEDR